MTRQSGEAFERLRAELSATFVSLPADQVEGRVVDALGRIGECLDLERASLYELSDAKTELTATVWARHEDVAGPSPRIRKANDPVRWAMLLERSAVVVVPDPAAGVLVAHAVDAAGVLVAQDSSPAVPAAHAVDAAGVLVAQDFSPAVPVAEIWAASAPLTIGGETIGAIEVASTKRQHPSPDDRDLPDRLTTLAEILANALARKRAARALAVSASALRKARAEAREHEERFRLIADTAPVMIWMADTARQNIYFNQPWLDFVGRTLSAERGSGWADNVHPEDLARCLATYTTAFDRRERFTVQYRLRRRDGEYRWMLATGVPRFDRRGGFEGYIGSSIDVTSEKLAEDALAALGGRLMEAQEQERRRIARELHDEICQRLAVLAIEIQQLTVGEAVDIHARSEELVNRTSDISADIQALSHQLHCAKLEYLGIAAAIRGFCAEFLRNEENATVNFTSSGVPTHLPWDVSLCLFRCLQEALRNAVKHSGVRHVEVKLHGTATMVGLTIRDRGRGFEPEAAMRGQGLGLISMRERVSLVKGTMMMISRPEWGTEISMRIPIQGNHEGRVATKQVYLIPSDRAS